MVRVFSVVVALRRSEFRVESPLYMWLFCSYIEFNYSTDGLGVCEVWRDLALAIKMVRVFSVLVDLWQVDPRPYVA